MTATEIRRDVEGYSDMTEDAFARRFYADRAELDALGHPPARRQARRRLLRAGELLARARGLPPAGDRVHRLRARRAADRADAARRRVRLRRAAAAGAAADHLGPPEPAGSDSRQTIGLGITASAGGSELSARLAKVDTAIYRRKRIEFEYYTMQTRRDRAAQGRPVPPALRGRPVVPRRPTRTSATPCASFRLSRMRGKVAYSTKAEHDFQRPADFDPRGYANRIPWQLGDAVGTGEVWVSEQDRLVRRAPVRRLRRDERRRGRRPRLPHRLRDPAPARLLGAALRRARARSSARPSSSTRRASGIDAIVERHRGEPFTVGRRRPPPGRAGGRARGRRALARRRGRHPPRALRPPGHARLRADRRRARGASA